MSLLPLVSASTSNEKPEILIIFVTFGLALGALTTHVLTRLPFELPYTVVVFLLGVVVAGIVNNTDLGDFGESAISWKHLDSELMLYLFLPVLIFGDAMSLKWHHVKGGFLQSLLLAGPGVLMGAYIMGAFVYYCLPFGWNWNLSMVFGSILAATDPVAVVALLKNAGASPKLTILIIGESLLNDGTAMVLFTLYYNLLKGDQYTTGDIVLFFFNMAIGSPLFGMAVGLVAVFWLSKANKMLNSDDTTIQIAITVCCAYLVFFVAQYEFEISGVLACCGAGVVFAWLSPPYILEHETMHHVWGFIEWTANTLIFLLAGLMIGSEVQKSITAKDWGYMVLLYLMLSLLRCFIIAVLYPALSRIGIKCNEKDAIFMCWAGLRGALSMALSIMVFSHTDELGLSTNDGDKVFFYVGGIASMTLFINATTATYVLQALGLLKDEQSPDAITIMSQVKQTLRQRSMEELMRLESDKYIVNLEGIAQYNSILNFQHQQPPQHPQQQGTRVRASVAALAMENLRRASFNRRGSQEDVQNELLMYCRTMFLDCVRVQYWQYIEEGKMPREALLTQCLLYSIDNALDRVHKTRLRDWKWLKNEMVLSPSIKGVGEVLQSCCPAGFALHDFGDVAVTKNIYLRVYILTNFIDAHESAQRKFLEFLGEEGEGEEGSGGAGAGSGSGDESRSFEQKIVVEESKSSVREARGLLMSIDPDVVSSIISQQAGRVLLNKQVGFVKEMLEEGLLHPRSAEFFFTQINSDLNRLDNIQHRVFRCCCCSPLLMSLFYSL